MSKNIEINLDILKAFNDSIPIFSNLNDSNRQEIIVLLSTHPDKGMTVNQIAENMIISRPTVSHHLKILKQTGLVNIRKNGLESYYYLTLKSSVKQLKQLIKIIEENCELY